VSHMAALIISTPGFVLGSHGKTKGPPRGVRRSEATPRCRRASKEYGFDRAKVFKDVARPDAGGIQSKEVSALLM